MRPAREPRAAGAEVRLLIVDPSARQLADGHLALLPRLLAPGDLLVVNDAATLPASYRATHPGGEACELRLLGAVDEGAWNAVLLGDGDWRTRTELRPPPSALALGSSLHLGETPQGPLRARIDSLSEISPRLVTVSFNQRGATLWQSLYLLGRPIQYAHLRSPLELWSVQTPYASRPWAVEAPSAGLPLSWRLLSALRAAGIGVAWLTHAAGISATGDPAIDASLPLPERSDIPASTVEAIARARAAGRQVVAVGTTVVRALEGRARGGDLSAGVGVTDLRMTPEHRPRIVDGLLTGMHEPTESHYAMLGAFAPPELLRGAFDHAVGVGYLGHEFGDVSLLLPGVAARLPTADPLRSAPPSSAAA